MSKNQVLRSEQSHKVQMPEGSKTASRARSRKSTEPAIEEQQPADRVVKVPPTARAPAAAPAEVPRATPAARARAPVAAPSPPAARNKATLDTRSKNTTRKTSATPATSPAKTPRSAAAPPPAPLRSTALPPPPPESALWEAQSPVMARLEQLRTRNAQIAEQIQRLTLTLPTRGKTP